MPTFTPPTVNVGTARPNQSAGVRAIGRIVSPLKVGQTLYKKNGTWFLVTSPSATAVDGADPIYVGGHVYDITEAVYNELVAAGYASVGGLFPSASTFPSTTTYPGV